MRAYCELELVLVTGGARFIDEEDATGPKLNGRSVALAGKKGFNRPEPRLGKEVLKSCKFIKRASLNNLVSRVMFCKLKSKFKNSSAAGLIVSVVLTLTKPGSVAAVLLRFKKNWYPKNAATKIRRTMMA
jgi:hypothetical protein